MTIGNYKRINTKLAETTYYKAGSQKIGESYNTFTNRRRQPFTNNRSSKQSNWRIAIKVQRYRTSRYDKEKEEKETQTQSRHIPKGFESITDIIQELWLEKNTDRHNSIQGQCQKVKITGKNKSCNRFILPTIINNAIAWLEIFWKTSGGNVRTISIKNTDTGNKVKSRNILEHPSR